MPDDPEGGSGNEAPKTFTQAQVDAIAANTRRSAVSTFLKEAGLDELKPDDLKTLATNASEYVKIKDGEEPEIERLSGELNSTKEVAAKVPTLELVIERQQRAGLLGLPARFWKYVEGTDEASITESVKALAKDLNFTLPEGEDENPGGNQNGADGKTQIGAGRPPAGNVHQGANNGQSAKPTLASGMEAYREKHKLNKS